MQPLSSSSRASLEEATARYHEAIPGSEADQYLQGRGFDRDSVQRFRLGVVSDPLDGHERLAGTICIPNICASGHVVGLKFRRLMGEPKYDGVSGEKKRLFHSRALATEKPFVAITEGELDAISLEQAGIPAVSVPSGAQSWGKKNPHYPKLFGGFDIVYVCVDSDEPGQKLAELIFDSLDNARAVSLPHGAKDANEVLSKYGADTLRSVFE